MGKENEGVHHYENILRLQPESVCGRYGLALLASTPTTALRLFQEIILSDRAFAPAYNGIGDILMEEDKGDEALEYLLRALDLDPTWVPVYRSLAMLFQTRGDENLAIHFRNSLHRLAPYFDDRHENSYLAFATKLKGQKEYTRSNEVLTSIAEIARAAASTDEQRVHFELGFEPWLKVKRISNLLDMGQTWTAEEMLGQLTRMINDISTDQTIQDGGPDLRLNLAKTLIDEGLADEAHDYLQKAAVDATPLDPAAVEWLETYDEDRRRMRHVLSGDRSLTKDEVTTFAVRTLTEVRGDKKGTGVFIDGEGLIVVPKSVVGDREEVEVLTYDGLVLAAKVIVHSRKAPFCIVKVPPLGEGVYFHFSLFQVPILHGQDPLIVVGQNDEGDYLHGELHLHQDVLDGNGVRYLLMDRPLEKAMDGAMVITEKGALVGFSMVLPKSDPQFRGRLVLDSDAVAHLACGIRKDFPFLYHSSFCGECGARLRPFQKTCACGTSDDDSDVGSV
jgi:tetratricopeptide (TPR) repeat protein